MRIKNLPSIESMNGSQDALVIEQTDGSEDKSRKVSPAQIKQYVLAGVTETSEQYAECSTARNVAAKTVTLPGFVLEAGARISVRFTNTGSSNPASGNITLNVNGTGAKEIVDSHTNKTKLTYTSSLFYNNMVNDFIYDGTYWVYMNRDNNTTYSSKTAASGGTATSLCTTGEKYTWNNKQNALTFDNVPTKNSNNPVKSGGIYSKIGDLTQTGLTGDSVAEQLTTAKNQIATKHNTDTVEFVGSVAMASNYLGTITASSLGISDCTKYNWDIRSKSWEAFPQIANVTASSVTFYVRWLSSASGGTVSLKNSGEVQITLTGMTRHDI